MKDDPPLRVVVLSDGETWERVDNASRALVVEVTDEDLARLEAGQAIGDVLAGRSGTRLSALSVPEVEVAFLRESDDQWRTVGPFYGVHVEGLIVLGVTGAEALCVATYDAASGCWFDEEGERWEHLAIRRV